MTEQLERLRKLDDEADAIRRELGLPNRGEVVAHHSTCDGSICVEADGYGKFMVVEYDGENPNDRMTVRFHVVDTEAEAETVVDAWKSGSVPE